MRSDAQRPGKASKGTKAERSFEIFRSNCNLKVTNEKSAYFRPLLDEIGMLKNTSTTRMPLQHNYLRVLSRVRQ